MLSNHSPSPFDSTPADAFAAAVPPPAAPAAVQSKSEHERAHWLRKLSGRRRLVDRSLLWRHRASTRGLLTELTYASFRLEGLDVARDHVVDAVAAKGPQRSLRSRQFRRLRNHLAILQQIEIGLRHNHALKPAAVVRWYTSISAGLSTTALADAPMARLADALRRINCPQLRLQGAIQECARVHHQLLHDPLVPGFNGILARLLLHHHLGKCNLPPVVFDPRHDAVMTYTEAALAVRLMQLLDQAYERMMLLSPTQTQ